MGRGRRRGTSSTQHDEEQELELLAFDADPDRLHLAKVAGLLSSPLDDPSIGPAGEPSHEFRIVRPRDLVHLYVRAYGCDLVGGGRRAPRLVPSRPDARLEVRFPFQHLAERAWYEVTTATPATNPKPPAPPPKKKGSETPTPPPTPVRAAHGTRLVFDIPAEEVIVFSTAGVLAALSRLPLRVPRLATARAESTKPSAFHEPLTNVGGGYLLLREPHGLALRAAPRSARRDPRSGEPIVAALRAARDAIAARRLLATEAAIDLTRSSAARAGIAGVIADELSRPPVTARVPKRDAQPPRRDQTAIEAPYRLLVSPSVQGGFAHSPSAVDAPTDESRVELWHTRLGVRQKGPDGWGVDERPDPQRIVRAVWARDIDKYRDDPPATNDDPFRTSLDPRDRRILVRQSAETRIAVPEPVEVDRLYLSALGAWLDLHGEWNVDPYAEAALPAILSWDHVAPMGRDQFVRVVYPGYLFPFGHRAAIVKVTERKIKADEGELGPQARLYQRKFIVVGEPRRHYEKNNLPFREVRVRPLTVPDIWDPLDTSGPPPNTPHVISKQDLFWPVVDGEKFRFTLDCTDHDHQIVRLHVPLLFVASHYGRNDKRRKQIAAEYEKDSLAEAAGQWAAFAPSSVPGDTTLEVRSFRFAGTPEVPGKRRARPRLASAEVVIPAMRHLSPAVEPVAVRYTDAFTKKGFNDAAQVFLELDGGAPTTVSYGSGTDRAGGFVEPNLPITQLSRTQGAIGDLVPAGSGFDPAQLLAGALPRLFGLFDLADVLEIAGLDQLPKFITEALDRIAALATDLERLVASVDATVTRLTDLAKTANAEMEARYTAAAGALTGLQSGLQTHVATVTDAFDAVLRTRKKTPDEVIADIGAALGALAGIVTSVKAAVEAGPLPPTIKAELERLVSAVGPVLQETDLLDTVTGFLRAIDPQGLSVRARYVWAPRMTQWPATGGAVFQPDPDGFTLSVETRASAAGGASAGADVLAELRDFSLNLLPGAELLRMKFGRIAFRATSGRKPEVDVVFDGIEFLGILGFIETLRELIPFDGFADPPHLDVSPEGVTAGFDLALPNVAVGVFSLENISLGADCRVPFLGDAVTVGFNFCTRERPFRLTVMAIGGGGFVAIRLSPEGLVVLEMALEAGASLSLDFGVASGSVSVMIGLYLRLESDKGSLTGYLRIRGEVDVLGLVSASITLELSLTYEFESGKMVGRASVVIEVEVLLFSGSVEVSVERRLAGSNGDPTFKQIMDVSDDGKSQFWDAYCRAFAEV